MLVSFEAEWKYDQLGSRPAAEWYRIEYDDTAWPSGPGLLGEDDAPLPHPIRTYVAAPDSGGALTTYYRHTFYVPRHATNQICCCAIVWMTAPCCSLTDMRCIGIVWSLVRSTPNLSTRQVMETAIEGPFAIDPGRLRPGTNVLAAEVHQRGSDNLDVVFGAELSVPADPSQGLWRVSELCSEHVG